MIPAKIFQVWIGPKKVPMEWMQTWINKNPAMVYELWSEDNIDDFGLVNRDKYDNCIEKGYYAAATDVAKVEILERFGGVYLDADLICLEPIENEPLMQRDFFAVPELNGRVNNAVIGSVAHHPILQEYIKRIGQVESKTDPAAFAGLVLTRCIYEYLKKDNIEILPSCSFHPVSQRGYKAPIEGKIYANHFWGQTKLLYEQQG